MFGIKKTSQFVPAEIMNPERLKECDLEENSLKELIRDVCGIKTEGTLAITCLSNSN